MPGSLGSMIPAEALAGALSHAVAKKMADPVWSPRFQLTAGSAWPPTLTRGRRLWVASPTQVKEKGGQGQLNSRLPRLRRTEPLCLLQSASARTCLGLLYSPGSAQSQAHSGRSRTPHSPRWASTGLDPRGEHLLPDGDDAGGLAHLTSAFCTDVEEEVNM